MLLLAPFGTGPAAAVTVPLSSVAGSERDLDVGKELDERLLDAGQHHLHDALAVVHGRVVPVAEEKEPQRPRAVPLQGLLDAEEVLEALAHLEALDIEVARVQEVVGPLRGLQEGLTLGDLVVVMGETQIHAAAVDVDAALGCGAAESTQRRLAHGAAFNVPSRPPQAPGGRPRGLAGLGRFPQGKVAAVALVLGAQASTDPCCGCSSCGGCIGEHSLALLQGLLVADVLRDELSVAVAGSSRFVLRGPEALDAEIHGPVGLVSVAPRDDAFDEGDDLGDELADPRHAVRREDAEPRHVREELLLVLARQLLEGDAGLLAPLDDLVVDVRDVHRQRDVVGEADGARVGRREQPSEDVERGVGSSVAHVRRVVHSGAAHVPEHLTASHGDERHLAAGQAVVDAKRKSALPQIDDGRTGRRKAPARGDQVSRSVLGVASDRGRSLRFGRLLLG